MAEQELIMEPNRLKNARPDLWPPFLLILKQDAPEFYEMLTQDENVKELMSRFESKLTIKVDDLPQRAQQLVYEAMKEAQERLKNQQRVN
ncbi:MAG: hypothetical protein KAS93_08195 [Gammaproteobacteria bacterium]|nr:hypothetical protein [Gammaproteobacteria bacterium]